MLNEARNRAVEILKSPQVAILATCGPAGLQVGEFPCYAAGLEVYLLLPLTSDHLYNLEEGGVVILFTTEWEMQGWARVISQGERTPNLPVLPAAWEVLVFVKPARLHIRREGGWGSSETIDLGNYDKNHQQYL